MCTANVSVQARQLISCSAETQHVHLSARITLSRLMLVCSLFFSTCKNTLPDHDLQVGVINCNTASQQLSVKHRHSHPTPVNQTLKCFLVCFLYLLIISNLKYKCVEALKCLSIFSSPTSHQNQKRVLMLSGKFQIVFNLTGMYFG